MSSLHFSFVPQRVICGHGIFARAQNEFTVSQKRERCSVGYVAKYVLQKSESSANPPAKA